MSSPETWRPTARPEQLKARAGLLRAIRAFFFERRVLEVETPLISTSGNTDPEIHSIRTGDGGYLRTSPEFALKRLLAAGSGDIFELGRVFRRGESGRSHNPEFTLLEWYRTGWDYQRLMDEVADLVRHCGRGKFDQWTVNKVGYRQLFLDHLGVDPFTADAQTLGSAARDRGIGDLDLDRNQWLDLLLSFLIQPDLPEQGLTFVYDYPAEQAALSRIRPDTPPVAERFELYLGRTELANGYQELTDANEQQRRFVAENAKREMQGKPVCRLDRHLISALKHGLPECAGVALGVDRLLMAMGDMASIDDVTAFPVSRA